MTIGGSTKGAGPPDSDVLDPAERRQLTGLRLWGTVGALLMMVGSASSYGAATPIPNPVDGIRLLGLLSRIGPAALAISYSGMGLVVVSWFLIGRLTAPGRQRRLSRTQLTHTLAMWTVPFLITPPIFSRDAYSYLAVGAMMVHGDNPYQSGPYDALGDSNAMAHQVDARWQHTSSPYGPAFLLIVKAIALVTGNHVIRAVLLQRWVELIGIALIVWALPRIARRCGFDPVSALWLGALNPLLLFHLIAGEHNEALMIGLMLAGMEIGLSARTGSSDTGPLKMRAADLLRVAAGAALITVATGIKATAAMALAFLAIALARRAGGRWADLWRNAGFIAVVTVVVFGLLTVAAGNGLGWIHSLSAPGSVQSFLSLSTALAVGAGQIGLLLGLGDHTLGTIDFMQPVGTAIGGALALLVMWRCWMKRIEPVKALGIALGAFVLLSPVIQPWYLLWAAVPLAASTGLSNFRRVTIWLSAIFAVIIMPNGATIPVFTIVQSVVVAVIVVGVVLAILRRSGIPQSAPAAGGLLHPVTSLRSLRAGVIGVAPGAAGTSSEPGDPYPGES